ncbi:MAG: phosphonate C-P lyase system protein PhnH [Alphaproteobacteria bacterium]|nr:phosphonate C-P lyase system protein PhnH [Alphaproteobacteria bacterium]
MFDPAPHTDPGPDAGLGFADPVLDAAACFRAILDAMAQPARPVALRRRPTPPAPLPAEAAAIALTLMDRETPLWLDPAFASPAVADYLRFQGGLRFADRLEDAAFAIAPIAAAASLIPKLAIGTAVYPDRSATAVLVADGLESGAAATLSGPGFEAPRRFAPAGADAAFWRAAEANGALFPQGVDLLIAAPGALAGLPRSARIQSAVEQGED